MRQQGITPEENKECAQLCNILLAVRKQKEIMRGNQAHQQQQAQIRQQQQQQQQQQQALSGQSAPNGVTSRL